MILRKVITQYKDYLTTSFKYGLLILVPKFISFFLIPFYWSFLSSSDYGVISLIYLIQEFLGVLLTLGLESVISRFYYDWDDRDKKNKIRNIWTLYLLSSVLISVLSYAVLSTWYHIFFNTHAFESYLHYALILAFLSSFPILPFSILRIKHDIYSFTKTQIFSFFTTSLISVFSLIYFSDKLLGFVLSRLIGELLVATYWFIYMSRNFGVGISFKEIKGELKYSLPIIFISALNNLNVTIDRFILEKFVSISSLGIFFLGKSFASNLSSVSQAIKMNFFPYIYRVVAISNHKSENDKSNEVARVSAFSYFVLCVLTFAFALFSSDIIFLIGRKFLVITDIIPLFCFGYLIISAESFLARGPDIVKKNSYDILTYFIGIIITVGFMIYLIPLYGILGAIYGFILSSGINSSIKIIVAHRLYPRPFNLKLVLYLIFVPIFICIFYEKLFTANGILQMGIKLLFVILYTVVGLFFFKTTHSYLITKIVHIYENCIKRD